MKKLRLFYLLLTLLLLFSCGTKYCSENKRYKIGDSEYVILKFNPFDKYPIFKNATATSVNKEEITRAEEIIKDKISYNLSQNKYKRQYVAVINDKGEKLIWINFFYAEDASSNWKTEIFVAYDGGNYFFRIKVNLTRNTYYDYNENTDS